MLALADDLSRAQQQLTEYLTDELPEFLRSNGEEIIMQSFRKEQYQGRADAQPWPKRKYQTKGLQRALLLLTGALRRSINSNRIGPRIYFSADTPYAKIHNEGGTITMPARSEVFTRPRHADTAKGKGKPKKGQFRRMREFQSGQGQTYKETVIEIPQRQYMPMPGEQFPALAQQADAHNNLRLAQILAAGQ